jgi:hypothetical protein
MSIWLRGSLLVNPYYRTAFRVARVPREVTRHRTVVQLIGQTRQLVNADPSAHSIGGDPVRASEINAAEQVLLDPVRRILEELLEHAAEKPPLERARQLLREAAGAMEAPAGPAAGPLNWKALGLLGPALIDELLRTVPGPGPSFGALELDTPPPFGRLVKE